MVGLLGLLLEVCLVAGWLVVRFVMSMLVACTLKIDLSVLIDCLYR